jgi:asparagine synthase (glutamine-hydrolysing)
MCGICGVFGLGPVLDDRDGATARRMAAMLRHRGPDGEGFLSDPHGVLGNTRLRITDLSANGDLPMSDPEGNVWLSYNGEITNFIALQERFDLGRKYAFRSSSDAEVLLYLYKEMGLDLLRHVTGMFAFSLYDRKAGRAYIVRDFFGLRPVFYAVHGRRLFFASEIKALLEIPDLPREIDHEAFFHYFSLAYIPGNKTPFSVIRELEAGRLIEVDVRKGEWKEREYYRLRYDQDPALGEREAASRLRELIRDSVRRNLRADKPVGLTLSGGVDTGSILGMARELGASKNLHTFSIAMSEPSFDESRYQRTLVDFARPVHHEIVVRPRDVLPHLERHIAFMDEPTGDGAAIPLYLLAQEAKKHVSVLLSGEGGDEVFNAYETHRAYKLRKLYRTWAPGALRRAIRALARLLPVSHKKLSLDFLLKRFTEGAEKGTAASHLYWRHAWSEDDKRDLMPGGGFQGTDRLLSDAFDRLDFDDDLNRLSWLDIKHYFVDDLMVKNDRMISAHSLEGRYPYMDRPLVEFAATIPVPLKLRGLEGRHIQKKALAGCLPPEILRRKNMGLEMPYSPWFMDGFRAAASRYFSRETVEKTGFLKFDAVERLWREHLSRKRDHGRALWTMLNFLVWFDLFVDRGNYKRHLSY